jgi:HEAT repeat protein
MQVLIAPARVLSLSLFLASVAGCRSAGDPNDLDPDRRREAAEALAGARDTESLACLRRLLADTHTACPSHPHVRGAAARSLGLSRLPEVLPDLLAALAKDPSSQVRVDAAEALGDLGAIAGAEPLRQALARPEEAPDVRRAAARALGRLGDQASISALARALGDPDRTVRLTAHRALVSIAGEDRGMDPRSWAPVPDPAKP